jgi:hypothetical protein
MTNLLVAKMYKFLGIFLGLLLLSPTMNMEVNAQSSHPNLFVSAENTIFQNHFAGSMVVEVVIRDSNISDTDEAKGEPDVTINGKDLRMVQGSDGNWYAYFANLEKAKQADQIAFGGLAGESLDFGVFCGSSTDVSVLGIDISETEGVSIPGSDGIAGFTQGASSFNACTGSPTAPSPNQNNVLRNAKSPNTNAGMPVGQIGLDVDAWPLIQLFSFSDDVTIIYNRGGGSQSVDLTYSDIPNISSSIDRTAYPKGAEVFVTVNDMQLNQDPTDVDSWTFNINSPRTTFYQAFTDSGTDSGNGGPGLVDLNPYLGSLGFEKNGNLGMNLGSVVILKTNQYQPLSFVTNGIVSYNNIVTLVESEPNSGIFQGFDYGDTSVIGISNNAPRGQSGSIDYNSKTTSIVTGDSTASVSLVISSNQFNPGQKATITLVDNDQNLNPGSDEDLDVFRSTAIIPTLKIGNPLTLDSASSVNFYAASTTSLASGTSVPSSTPDKNSERLVIDSRSTPNGPVEKISVNLGITVNTLQNLLLNSPQGTSWLNFDLRSLEQQFGINSFSDTTMTLHFGGLPGTSTVQILDTGDMSSGQGMVMIDDNDITTIYGISGSSQVYLEINFDQSSDTANAGTISNETDTQPIVIDFLSFGNKNSQRFNNAIYRAELEETTANSSTFTGTMEYAVVNQLNQNDPNLIKNLRTISNEIKFLVNDSLEDEDAINLAYSDLATVGVTIGVSAKTEIKTQTGNVTLESQTYRFGQPVVVVLTDPDLNTKHDTIETYNVVNNPSSSADDTVGDSNGNVLLEIRIKGFRYHRCTINSVEYGGLGSTGFSLVETGPGTGIFKGSFRMPSQICNEAGTKLISPAGGSIEASYFDFRDSSGEPREIGLTFPKSTKPQELTKIEDDEPIKLLSVLKTQIKDSFDRPILYNPSVGQKIKFTTEISNSDYVNPQSYSYIIQVKDENNKIIDLRWINGEVDASKRKITEISWQPSTSGMYTVEIFLWDGLDTAIPLSAKTEYNLSVGSN